MIEKIKKIVERKPNKKAYIVGNDFITYKELWDKANYYAMLLSKEGTSPVIIYGNKEINSVVSILACILSNRTYIPIGSCTPVKRLEKIIEMTKSSLILSGYNLEIDNIDICSLEKLDRYKDGTSKLINNDIVYIIFTSGSTGDPKGVPISKDNLNNFIDWISSIKPLCDYEDVNVLNEASFSFDLSVADLYYSLCNGHTLYALNDDINDGLDELFKVMENIDVAVLTPTFIKLCLLNRDFNSDSYKRLKCIYFCGEQLEVKTVKKIFDVFPNLNVINAYGPTEATSAVSSILITKDMLDETLLPVGDINTFATDIRIVNDEIVLSGKSVFNGYLGSNELIKEYHTKDIGYIKDGKLYCKGRLDSQVKYKGYRIELNDIEYNINKINGVMECAVVAKYDDNNNVKTIKAFVVTNKDSNYIKEELEKLIPIYMMPKSIKVIDRLPVNSNGKVDRKALRDL